MRCSRCRSFLSFARKRSRASLKAFGGSTRVEGYPLVFSTGVFGISGLAGDLGGKVLKTETLSAKYSFSWG